MSDNWYCHGDGSDFIRFLSLPLSLPTVIGAVALTMQPLWPDSTRAGMWYLSMGVFVLMGAMVTLIVGKFISFHPIPRPVVAFEKKY